MSIRFFIFVAILSVIFSAISATLFIVVFSTQNLDLLLPALASLFISAVLIFALIRQ